MTMTIIILLSAVVVLLVLLIAVLVWRVVRQSRALQEKNEVIVREVRRNQSMIRLRECIARRALIIMEHRGTETRRFYK